MKSVLMSIAPKWCEPIANGKKTIEIRKTKPKLEAPFKCYIYCTKLTNLPLKEYVEIHSKTGGGVDNWSGKVIGEFVCDGIISHCEMANADIAERQGKIQREDLFKYANGKELYGWHISDLKIYVVPKELSEFYRLDKPIICNVAKCGICEHWKYMRVNANEYDYDCDCNYQLENRIAITRPPQSWCYVESVIE